MSILNVNIGTCVLSRIQENKSTIGLASIQSLFLHIKKFLAYLAFLS